MSDLKDTFDFGKVEPEYHEAFKAWRIKPGPIGNRAIMDVLQPAIRQSAKTHTGADDDVTVGHARRIMLDALPGYDPSRASLRTFAYQTLQRLKRAGASRMTGGIRIPERQAQAAIHLKASEKHLLNELGRDPTDEETADHSGLNFKQIREIRRKAMPVNEGRFVDPESGDLFLPSVKDNRRSTWAEIVYHDLGPQDKAIMEHSMGLNGRSVLQGTDLAAKLKVSPGLVSQRKAFIQSLLDQEPEIPV